MSLGALVGNRSFLTLLFGVLLLLPAFANQYTLFVGNLMLIYIILALGLNILVGFAGLLAFANAAPYATISIWEAHRTREPEAAADWQNRIGRPAYLVTAKHGVPGLKYAMDLMGYYGGPPRLPLIGPTPEAKMEIEEAFADLRG